MYQNKLKVPVDFLPENVLIQELRFLDGPMCFIERVPNLIMDLELTKIDNVTSQLMGDSRYRTVHGGEGFLPEDSFIFYNSYILGRRGIFNVNILNTINIIKYIS